MNFDAAIEPLRVAVVADGAPSDPSTNSGVARGVLDALRADPRVEVVAEIDSTPPRLSRLINAALSFRMRRHQWRNTARKGWLSTRLRSSRRDRALRDAPTTQLVIHVRNTYLPSRIPYVAFLDGAASISQRSWPEWTLPALDYKIRLHQEKRYLSSAVAVFTAGDHVRAELRAVYGIEEKRAYTIGGGINFDINSIELPDRSSRPRHAVRLLFVGTEFERKGGPQLLKAFERSQQLVPELELVIVGPSPEASSTWPLRNVLWAGRVASRDAMADFYRSADIFCLPSVYEPYGLAVQEAMAFGLPSIVSDTGALDWMIGGNVGGIVVAQGDETALAEAITQLAREPELRREMGNAARDLLAGRTWMSVTDRLVTTTFELIGRGQR